MGIHNGTNRLEFIPTRLPLAVGFKVMESINHLVTLTEIPNFSTQPRTMSLVWLRTVFFNFFVAACMGLTLRLAHVVELSWLDFKNMMHAHSHTAMLGWLFMVIYALILDRFVDRAEGKRKIYATLFWAAQFSVVGMMISFPIQGYGSVSIAFTTLHLLIAYAIALRLLRNLKTDGLPSTIMMRSALVLMLISTIGVWLLGPIQAGLFGDTAVYYMSIQFFLHFQFNGWFTFAALALVFRQIEHQGTPLPENQFWLFYTLILTSTILTYALSVTWSTPENYLFWLNGAGVLIQLAALYLFIKIIWRQKVVFTSGESKISTVLYAVALASFAGKILIQTAVVIPEVAIMSYTIRQFVVGFIHLTMLGSITCYILGALAEHNHLSIKTNSTHWGLIFLVIGFVTSEGMLFLQGLALWMELGFMPTYYESILIASIFLPVGIAFILASLIKRETTSLELSATK